MAGEMTSGEAKAGGVVAPFQRDLATLEAELHRWLAEKLGAADLTTTNFTYPSGAGLSHETILFDAEWTENGAPRRRGLVIRIKPTRDPVYRYDWFEEQYRIMETLHRLGTTPVATPLWLERDPAIVGSPFFVMEKRIGKVPVSFPAYSREGWVKELAPEARRRLWTNAVTALASIQKVPLSEVEFLNDGGRHPGGVDQEWDRWREYYDWAREGEAYPLLDAAWAELERTKPAVHKPGIVWGDARIGNMMFDDRQNVVAVMDWEAPGLGGALHDLAYWCVTGRLETEQQGVPRLEGMGSREETIALWTELTGIDASDIAWYEQFASFKLSCFAVRMMGRQTAERVGMNRIDNPATRVLAQLFGLPAPDSALPPPRRFAPAAG